MAKSKLKTHIHENSKESLGFLEENEGKFTEECWKVLQILNTGVRLTVAKAIAEPYFISSLPRRILDLRERNGITSIKDDWIRDGRGKRVCKEWWIDIATRPTKGEVIKRFDQSGPAQQVTLRDGTILNMGDEVETDAYPQCKGQTFVICEMNPWPGGCESGVMVVAHLKGDESRKLKGFKKEGADLGPEGLDANWFKKKT